MNTKQFISRLKEYILSTNPEILNTVYLVEGAIICAIFYNAVPGIETGSYIFQVDNEMARIPIGDMEKKGPAFFEPASLVEKELWYRNYENGEHVTHIEF